MVSLHWHYGDLNGQMAIIGIMGSSEETPLNVARPSGMRVPSSVALNLSESLYQTIGNLQRDK